LPVSAVSLSSESLDSIYTMTLWKAEKDLIRVSLSDELFVALLHKEGLAEMPEQLAQRVR